MIEPMTDAEWQEFDHLHRPHGPPPWEMLRRIFGLVDRLTEERDQARTDLKARDIEVEDLSGAAGLLRIDLGARDLEVVELKGLSSRAWYHYKDGFDDLPEFKTVEGAVDYFWGSASFIVAADPNVKPPAWYVAREELEEGLKQAEARVTEASGILSSQPPDRFTVAEALCVLDRKKGGG